MLSLSHSEWHGIGEGHGHLAAREVTVTVTNRMTGRPRSARLWLPAVDETIRRAQPHAASRRAGPAQTEVIPYREATG